MAHVITLGGAGILELLRTQDSTWFAALKQFRVWRRSLRERIAQQQESRGQQSPQRPDLSTHERNLPSLGVDVVGVPQDLRSRPMLPIVPPALELRIVR